MSLTPEEIEKNWLRFRSLCEKLGERAPAVIRMVDELDERLCLCPASAKKSYHNAFPGGLCSHSLNVLQNLVILNNAYEWKLPKDSMIVAALFHDVGKCGMPGKNSENDFYLPQTDGWRLEKLGEEYKYNDDIPYMTTPHRSIFMMQHYGIQLTVDEHLSILLNDGFLPQENKAYGLKIGPLVYGLQTADYIATCDEGRKHGWARVIDDT
jgi:hypothetical protein